MGNTGGRSPKFIIFTTVFIDLIGFGMIIPILGPTAREFVPAHPGAAAAALMGCYSVLQIIFSPIWGRISDRFGRRPILLMSLAGSTASYLIFALSGNFWLLLFSRTLAGLFGANITAAQAYIADITSKEDRTAGMGLIGMAFGLGFALGPVFGSGAALAWGQLRPEDLSHVGPGLLAAAICGLNLLVAVKRLPESLPAELRGKVHTKKFATFSEIGRTLSHPTIGSLILLFFVVTFAFANLEVSFTLFADKELKLPHEGIYGLMFYIGLILAFTQGYFIRKAVKFVPEAVWVIIGCLCLTVGLLLMPLHHSVGYMFLPLTILSFGNGICMPSLMSLISRGASATDQGQVMGTSQAASSFARLCGPVCGGLLFDLHSNYPFWFAALVMMGATVWAHRTRQRLLQDGFGDETVNLPEWTQAESEG